jgi:CheY-like chemotaxis protein
MFDATDGTVGGVADYFRRRREFKNQLRGTGLLMAVGEQDVLGGKRGSDSLLDGDARARSRDEAQRGPSRPRVLVVEDETWIAIELQRALSDGGYEVIGLAADADTALRLAEERRPALALMDVHLAGRGDGIDAAMRLRERFGIRSVFLSGHLDATMRRRAEATQPLAVLDKPVTPEHLLRAISAALGSAPVR